MITLACLALAGALMVYQYAPKLKQFLPALPALGSKKKDPVVELVDLWQAYYSAAANQGCQELAAGLEALFPHNLHSQAKPEEPAK